MEDESIHLEATSRVVEDLTVPAKAASGGSTGFGAAGSYGQSAI